MDQSAKESVVSSDHKYSSYTAIKGYSNFYRNEKSQKIMFKKNIGGRIVKFATGTTKILEAKRFVDDKLLLLLSNNPKAEVRKKKGVTNPSIEEMWNELIEEKRPGSEHHTLENYNTSARHGFGPFWFKLTVKDVTQANQIAFEKWYLQNRGDKTYYNTRKHLRMLFRFLFRQKLISEIPEIRDLGPIVAKNIKAIPVGRVYSDEEIESMLSACSDVGRTPEGVLRLELYLLMGREQGRRQMEVLSSEWSNNNLQSKISKVWSFKNKKWREIPMTKGIFDRLKTLRELSPKDKFIFPAALDPSRHTASQIYNRSWSEVKSRAKINNGDVRNAARYHDLRHTFATQTVIDEWPVIVACQTLDMTAREYQRTYTHIKSGDINKYMRQSFEVAR